MCWGEKSALVSELLCHINITSILHNLWGLPRCLPASTVVREKQRLSLTNFFFIDFHRDDEKKRRQQDNTENDRMLLKLCFAFCFLNFVDYQ